MTRQAGAVVAVLFIAHAVAAQFGQQAGKLVGTGSVGRSRQGQSVAISGDGNTAIVGGYADNAEVGGAWGFTRSEGFWSQLGNKLVATGAVGPAQLGWAVAISADGDTAIVGGPADGNGIGAAWVFTRSEGVWSQEGTKLVGSGAVGAAQQGSSVAISADGNTVIVGGPADNSRVGAAWIFSRSLGVWWQQGGKLVATDAVGGARQGSSVSISADSRTAVVGGPGDNTGIGATWVFTRIGAVWSQQGGKLVGTGAVGGAGQGESVAISADGNTAIVGGPGDASGMTPDYGLWVGAAWVFTRSGGVWFQQGNKLVGADAAYAGQGWSVAISADGNTAIVGGPRDNGPYSPTGAAWVFTRSGGGWSQMGRKLVGTGGGYAALGTSVAISADGRTTIVGGPGDNSDVGAAWVYSLPAFTAWVPVVAHNPGLNGSQWRSDLGLLNPGAVTANVQIRFYGGDGVTTTTYVPAGTQSILTGVVGQLGASGQGALEVLGDQPLKVTSRTYNQVSSDATCYPNGTQGQDYPALAAREGLSAAQSAHLAGLVENASYRSNIGLVNVGSVAATVLVELYDGAGTKLSDYTMALVAGQWKQETQPFKNKAGQTGMDRGYAKVTVTSGTGVFAFASVVDNITNDPTTIAMQR